MIRTTLAELDYEQLAAALELAYADYLAPVQFTPALAAEHVERNAVDLQQSSYWYDENGLVALSLLGVRQRRGWIGGFGVAPAHRGLGVAAGLLRDTVSRARELDLTIVQLEVLDGNDRAYQVYRKGGFRDRSRVSSLFPPAEMDPLPAGQLVSPHRIIPPPLPCVWQRELPWALDERGKAVILDQTWMLIRPDLHGTVLLQTNSPDTERTRRLLGALRHHYPQRMPMITNEPVDSLLHAQLRELGWIERYPQTEMFVDL